MQYKSYTIGKLSSGVYFVDINYERVTAYSLPAIKALINKRINSLS